MTTWISVEERPPERGKTVWVYGHCWDGTDFRKKPQVERGELGSGGWWDNYGDAIDDVTHWQPYTRPEPPEEAK